MDDGVIGVEETLDPADSGEWEAFAALAHRMLDDALRYQRELRSGPAWRPMPAEAKAALRGPLPREGLGAEAAYGEFRRWVEPYNYGNVHPRHWGWVNGQGTPLAVMAELLAATMNPNCWGGEHAASYVEAQVLEWLGEALGVPPGYSGVLVSGGSMANVIGLAAAREARAAGVGDAGEAGGSAGRLGPAGAVARAGLRALDRTPVLYASREAHNSLDKAAALLGLGFEAVRKVPVDGEFRMDVAALREQVELDEASGLRPFCVAATAGTVNTGAIDPLGALADLCAEHGLWLHVDGAFGALAALAPGLRPLLAGMERADSIAFDLHKWLYLPIEVGCVLVRDPEAHRAPFSPPADYLQRFERGIPAGEHFFNVRGPQLTRSFRALKVWLCMQAYGMDRYARLIEQNVAQARLLARRVREHPGLELLAPVPLNVVCFRYTGGEFARDDAARRDEELDELNRELLMRLWESGTAAPSGTIIHERFALRCAFTNHRTRSEDIELLLDAVTSIGDGLLAERKEPGESAGAAVSGTGPEGRPG